MSNIKKVTLNESEVQTGIKSSTGKKVEITIEIPRGTIACFLLDEYMYDILPDYPYEIYDQNKKILGGETDEYGYFYHENLPAKHYILKVKGIEYILPTLQENDEPFQVRVIGEEGPEFESDDIRDITEDNE